MKLRLLLLLLFAYLGLSCMSDKQANQTNISKISGVLPDQFNGWRVAEEDRTYTGENLHEYINGGAELYISYSVESVFARVYSKNEQPDIIVDIFDMGSSPNAFGIFSHSRETVEADFGQGSQYSAGLLQFWKDRYYISLLASPETDEAKASVQELARRIESAIPKEGGFPDILRLLPKEGLQEESVRFFHHYIWLNSHYFIAGDNILFIDDNTDAVLARYGDKGDTSILLLVRYPGEEDALRARDSFIENYLPENSDSPVVAMEDGSWTGYKIVKDIFAVVFASPNEAIVRHLLDSVSEDGKENSAHSP
jgi:hypothetical protein